MSIVFWFLVLISPFVLWRLAMIGPSFVSTGSRTHFLITQPPPQSWLHIARLFEDVVRDHGDEIQKAFATQLPDHHISLDFPAIQSAIVRTGLMCLARAVKLSESRRIGIEIDYEHQMAPVLKLTVRQEDRRFSWASKVD